MHIIIKPKSQSIQSLSELRRLRHCPSKNILQIVAAFYWHTFLITYVSTCTPENNKKKEEKQFIAFSDDTHRKKKRCLVH